MKEKIRQLRHDLGPLGLASFGLLALAAAFLLLVVKPMQARQAMVEEALARPADNVAKASSQLETLYAYLDREEETTDWLAKLHAIGRATGVATRSATYRTLEAGTRLERYEIVLPASGTYTQIRDFLKRALADIPVLSLDQVSLRREKRGDDTVQAELRLSIHRVKQ
jgi:Tfp pilus assembly protein PilO